MNMTLHKEGKPQNIIAKLGECLQCVLDLLWESEVEGKSLIENCAPMSGVAVALRGE